MGARDKAKAKRGGNRGGGSRFQAQSAEDIERRSARLEEFDQRRAQRRADAADEDEEEKEKDDTEEKMGEMTLKGGKEKEEDTGDRPLTRKQRELAEKERAAADYQRRHKLGLTEEYKKDMSKLAEVRARREASEARAKMEKDAADAIEDERRNKAVQLGAFDEDSDDEGKKKKSKKKTKEIPKLDKITIKKMKPAQMKEELKLRGLEIQGNSKQLTERLSKYEASR
mmetsp:Transcript_14371/g.13888  ORF Transcript_14371/g.13888 Transcript_14371/m.13888 type:complete len:227 (-) Transcript_14371:159-839(-)|eukprot:CAMPEP_0197831140 /NCGR_PEP_ID=MMETSP1437-20131217/7727_1 /TAXON_ID=49252 ORGANISM="Eucampia antarctica, Strain CCMP1452" /NCGR_SAMPLE_ID=MMETSP1437 /ASSEMBLY_ACC=CAM_ASM_001096 /LENGTH=226 /DNA_ID=CAMNT_0043433923 /DNA_START=58 /DNA_END=738 /DNA_ORIENTATION=-